MSVKDVSTESEFKKLTDNGLAVVKYSAEWCGPCKRVHPQYKELAKHNADVNFLHVDIDSSSESMPNQVSDIFSVPTFHFYKNGKVVDKLEGANINMLKTKLEKLKEKKTENKDSENDAKSSSEGGEVKEVTTGKEYNEIIATGKTIVDFSAVWCMPCKILVPIFKKLAEEFKDIKFIKVDVDDNDDELASIINDLKIVAVPSFLFYHNNKLVERLAGGNAVVLRLNAEKLSAREDASSNDAKQESGEKNSEETKPNDVEKEAKTEKPNDDKMETGEESNEPEKSENVEATKDEKPADVLSKEPVVENKDKQEPEEKNVENKDKQEPEEKNVENKDKQEPEEKKVENENETKENKGEEKINEAKVQETQESQNEVEEKKEPENEPIETPKETAKESEKPVESKNNE